MPDAPPAFGIARLDDGSGGSLAIVSGGRVVRLAAVAEESGLPADVLSVQGLFERWDDTVDAVAQSLSRAGEDGLERRWPGAVVPISSVRLLPPVVPRQILQAGANYRTHVVQLIVAQRRRQGESEDAAHERAAALMDERAAHGTPYIFVGLPTSLCGAEDDVVLPALGSQHDWELELAVVIGARAWRVDRRDALSVVAGYTIANDLTSRDLVHPRDLPDIGTDWFLAKNAPTFLPVGPSVVPRAFVPDYRQLRLTLRVNGTVMQDAPASDMIFGIEQLIEHASHRVELLPGDLLLTGSPAGNGAHFGRFLQPGDVMEGTISGLGTQRNRCVAASGPEPGRAT